MIFGGIGIYISSQCSLTVLCGHFFWIRPYITHSYKYILVCITVQFRLYWYDECLNNHINTYCLYCISNSNRYLRIVILNAMEKEEMHTSLVFIY